MNSTLLNRILLVLGFGGVFVSGVLSLAELLHKEVPCGADSGCATVAADPSSHLLGMPNAYLGFFAYVVLAGFATYRELVGNGGPKPRFTINAGYGVAALGTVASIILTFISITQIHATCKWCLTSAVIMTLSLVAYVMLTLKAESAPVGPSNGLVGVVMIPALAIASVIGMGVAASDFKTPNVRTTPMSASDLSNLVPSDAHVKNPNGALTLVEFGDLDCPNCKHSYPQIEQIVDNSNGRIRYVFHNFPLYQIEEHKGALPGAVIAEIAGEKGKFWQYLDVVYGDAAGDPNAPPPGAEAMINFGVRVGLDPAVLRKRVEDVNDPAFKRMKRDLDLARIYNIRQTPYFIVLAPGMPKAEVAGSGIFDLLDQPAYKKLIKGP